MNEITLYRYHGLGNDYLVFDPQKNSLLLNEEIIKHICDRNFGCGSDGVLFGPVFDGNRMQVKIYNSDGSEAEKSGNGVRIFSKYVKDAGYVTGSSFTLNTLGGNVKVDYLSSEGDLIKIGMGTASFLSNQIPITGKNREVVSETFTFGGVDVIATCLSIGNPHCVIPMENITKESALKLGPLVENCSCFPNRINMQLLKVINRNNIAIEIYERGSGYTLASGSSSCAAATAAYKLGLVDSNVTVHMPGGTLKIEIMPDYFIYMTGTVSPIGKIILAPSFVKELLALR